MKKLMMSAILLTSFSASAIEITYNNTQCATPAICNLLDAEVKKIVDADLPEADVDEYAVGVSNANGFAYKGLGSDYSDDFDFFMIRGAVGLAVDGDLKGDIENVKNAKGFGIGAAATIGVNLDLLPIDKIGPIDLEKMDLFISLMSYNLDHDIDDNSNAKGEISNFSVMARYQIMDGVDFIPGYMLEWGGVYLHTGFQRSTWNVDAVTNFSDTKIDYNDDGTDDAVFKGAKAEFEIGSTTTTIPIEVSTYLRAAYVFTFFGGAGFDIVSGSADVQLKAGGSVEDIADPNDYTTELSASESVSGDADATNFRAFGGIQFNVPFVSLYAQINKGLGNDLIGFNTGLKILW